MNYVYKSTFQIFLVFALEYRDTFSLFDKQGDGRVECSSLGEMLRALGLNPTEAEVKKIVAEIDPTGRY